MQNIKDTIRNNSKYLRKSLPNNTKKLFDNKIFERFKSNFNISQNETYAAYINTSVEVDTSKIIKFLINNSARVCLPIIHPFSSNQLIFQQIDKNTKYSRNNYGIKEPTLEKRKIITSSNIQKIIIPLVSFNSEGRRLGMGGGYYDRLYSQLSTECVTIGLAYDLQYNFNFKHDEWDMPFDYVLTPSKTLNWKNYDITSK